MLEVHEEGQPGVGGPVMHRPPTQKVLVPQAGVLHWVLEVQLEGQVDG